MHNRSLQEAIVSPIEKLTITYRDVAIQIGGGLWTESQLMYVLEQLTVSSGTSALQRVHRISALFS